MKLEELDKILMNVQKPSRYAGGELGSVVKTPTEDMIRFAMCFPDMYDVGMSHLGMKILYSLKNAKDDIWCERVFAPDIDMEEAMRKNNIPLYGLESLDPIKNFDFIGFTLQYELSYTAILNMLDLAGLPIRSAQRQEDFPVIIAGGPCACNPEPIADFIDIFVLGEGEEVNLELIYLYKNCKKQGLSKKEFLEKAAQIEGIYVPSFYDVEYDNDNKIKSITAKNNAPQRVKKRIIKDLDKVFYPKTFVVPYSEIIHDRAMTEVQRGCIRGCRFCQAGFIYRPVREKNYETINKDAFSLCEKTGYEEVSLTSLSTSDYRQLEPLLDKMLSWSEAERVNISLPSLRIDNFSPELIEKIARVRKSGLTFAPEAGTQRMRDVINKNITEENIMSSCKTAFEAGYCAVKLYFMMGLPTETDEDIVGIAQLGQRIVDLFYAMSDKPKGKGISVTISCACFVPKPFTPFEFEPQDSVLDFERKQKLLRSSITTKKINISYHDAGISVLEGVLARGDRRLCDVIELAWKKGSKLDAWGEYFKMSRWEEAMAEAGISAEFYANRQRSYEEISPWSHLDYLVSKDFLIKENKLARSSITTPNCREKCTGCGANMAIGGKCQ
ncbi:MAG: TIGR03960 family B12-binding radical SAM protein [Oscillospiraceae bacterium]